jgi:hypothetical protein
MRRFKNECGGKNVKASGPTSPIILAMRGIAMGFSEFAIVTKRPRIGRDAWLLRAAQQITGAGDQSACPPGALSECLPT